MTPQQINTSSPPSRLFSTSPSHHHQQLPHIHSITVPLQIPSAVVASTPKGVSNSSPRALPAPKLACKLFTNTSNPLNFIWSIGVNMESQQQHSTFSPHVNNATSGHYSLIVKKQEFLSIVRRQISNQKQLFQIVRDAIEGKRKSQLWYELYLVEKDSELIQYIEQEERKELLIQENEEEEDPNSLDEEDEYDPFLREMNLLHFPDQIVKQWREKDRMILRICYDGEYTNMEFRLVLQYREPSSRPNSAGKGSTNNSSVSVVKESSTEEKSAASPQDDQNSESSELSLLDQRRKEKREKLSARGGEEQNQPEPSSETQHTNQYAEVERLNQQQHIKEEGTPSQPSTTRNHDSNHTIHSSRQTEQVHEQQSESTTVAENPSHEALAEDHLTTSELNSIHQDEDDYETQDDTYYDSQDDDDDLEDEETPLRSQQISRSQSKDGVQSGLSHHREEIPKFNLSTIRGEQEGEESSHHAESNAQEKHESNLHEKSSETSHPPSHRSTTDTHQDVPSSSSENPRQAMDASSEEYSAHDSDRDGSDAENIQSPGPTRLVSSLSNSWVKSPKTNTPQTPLSVATSYTSPVSPKRQKPTPSKQPPKSARPSLSSPLSSSHRNGTPSFSPASRRGSQSARLSSPLPPLPPSTEKKMHHSQDAHTDASSVGEDTHSQVSHLTHVSREQQQAEQSYDPARYLQHLKQHPPTQNQMPHHEQAQLISAAAQQQQHISSYSTPYMPFYPPYLQPQAAYHFEKEKLLKEVQQDMDAKLHARMEEMQTSIHEKLENGIRKQLTEEMDSKIHSTIHEHVEQLNTTLNEKLATLEQSFTSQLSDTLQQLKEEIAQDLNVATMKERLDVFESTQKKNMKKVLWTMQQIQIDYRQHKEDSETVSEELDATQEELADQVVAMRKVNGTLKTLRQESSKKMDEMRAQFEKQLSALAEAQDTLKSENESLKTLLKSNIEDAVKRTLKTLLAQKKSSDGPASSSVHNNRSSTSTAPQKVKRRVSSQDLTSSASPRRSSPSSYAQLQKTRSPLRRMPSSGSVQHSEAENKPSSSSRRSVSRSNSQQSIEINTSPAGSDQASTPYLEQYRSRVDSYKTLLDSQSSRRASSGSPMRARNRS